MEISFSISDTFSTAAALLIGPAAGAFTAALDGLMLSFRMQSSTRTRAPRAVQPGGAGGGHLGGVAGVLRGWPARRSLIDGPFRVPRLFALLALFGVLNFGISTGLVAAAVGLEARKSPLAIWKEHFLGLWLTLSGRHVRLDADAGALARLARRADAAARSRCC